MQQEFSLKILDKGMVLGCFVSKQAQMERRMMLRQRGDEFVNHESIALYEMLVFLLCWLMGLIVEFGVNLLFVVIGIESSSRVVQRVHEFYGFHSVQG